MENEFKKIISDSKLSIKKIEKNIEGISKDFTKDVNDFWLDLKKHLSETEEKLDNAYDDLEDEIKLKAHLGMIEAGDKIKKIEDVAYEFISSVSTNTHEELDIAKLKAHLLKMESKDLWKEKEKELLALYENSKEESEKLAIKAAKELNHIFLKLTEIA
jgi:gas vesicle protein